MNGISEITSSAGNPFLSGGLIMMAVGALMALFRRAPNDLWNWLKLRFTVSVDVMNSDPAFEWLTAWLDAHPYSRRATRLSLTTSRGKEGQKPVVVLTPAPGNHFFVYRGRLVWFHRDREQSGGGAGPAHEEGAFAALRRRETYNIRVIGRSQSVARQIIEDARESFLSAAKAEPELFASNWGCWERTGPVPPRPLDSVILPGGTTEMLVADVHEFLVSREWYTRRGIPYRRGYLFHGVPGSGKSSVIAAVASHLGLHLYALSLAGVPSDESLAQLFSTAREGAVILLEDVDAAARRELKEGKDSERGITFSGLLNALDGVAAREGLIVVMKTNHKERLDPALIRPGRVDVEVEFGNATREQAARLFSHFFPGHAPGLATAFSERAEAAVSVASLQQHLLRHKNDPHAAAQVA